GDVTIDEFISAVNVARPSLIRTEADELTYPVHIMIRYELEKGIFDGTISTDHLDEAWNAKYKEYLGVEVKDAKDGILQDVHWADGSFGYFPTYALGSAFAAQFVHQMRSEIDVDELLRTGRYGEIQKWLREKFQHYGCFYDAPEIMKLAAGAEFDPRYYIDYLENKYRTLYHLDAEV
ncbi:MAG: carboxypeptidase M32, partial [Firmicutes bacterium]|nr:carboxypeptidase M32 [Bacillota bacterium]